MNKHDEVKAAVAAVEYHLTVYGPERTLGAVAYLEALLPELSPAWRNARLVAAALEVMIRDDVFRDGPTYAGTLVVQLLNEILRDAPAPITRLREPGDLAELQERLGVSDDWHEPDQVEVDVVVTEGNFANAGHVHLERQLIIRQGRTAVARVELATLCAWAAAYGRHA